MTVKQLKKILEKYSDDDLVVVRETDEYTGNKVSCSIDKIRFKELQCYNEVRISFL